MHVWYRMHNIISDEEWLKQYWACEREGEKEREGERERENPAQEGCKAKTY